MDGEGFLPNMHRLQIFDAQNFASEMFDFRELPSLVDCIWPHDLVIGFIFFLVLFRTSEKRLRV